MAQKEKRFDEAARLLDGLRAAHPRNFWLTLSRGNLEYSRAPERAFELYELAAKGFAEEKNAEGEVMARHNLRLMLYRKGRHDEAGSEVQRALAAAQASGEPTVLARAWALEATHLTDTGRSVSQALASLRRAEATAFPDGPYTLRRSILFALANACFQLGRYEDALGYYQRVEALTEETGDQLTRASARYNVVNTRMRQMEELPRPGAREEIVAQAQAALETAVEADNREIQVLLHRTLGELFEGPEGRPDESRTHYERCVDLARRIGQPRELAHCLWSLAGELAEKGEHREARRVMDEALSLASGTGHVWSIAHASRKRMRVSWATLPVEQALPESLQSLAAIEAVRDLQQEEGAASVFSAWVSDYQWLAGRLLESPGRSREALSRPSPSSSGCGRARCSTRCAPRRSRPPRRGPGRTSARPCCARSWRRISRGSTPARAPRRAASSNGGSSRSTRRSAGCAPMSGPRSPTRPHSRSCARSSSGSGRARRCSRTRSASTQPCSASLQAAAG